MNKTDINSLPFIQNLNDLYNSSANKYNDKVAYRFYSKEGIIDTLTYSQLKVKIDRIIAGLDSLGLIGRRVAIIGETSPDWISTYIAVLSSGGVVIPLDKELLVNEISNFLNTSEADAIVFSSSFNKKFDSFYADANTIKCFIPMDPDGYTFPASANVIRLDDVISMGQTKLSSRGYKIPVNTDMTKMSCMLFTSGTTGTSKCVMLSESNIVSCVNSIFGAVDFNHEDVVMSVLPLHHTYELACMLAELTLGLEICINDSLKKVLKNMSIFKPTGLVLVPLFVSTIHKRIWDEAKKKGKDDILRKGIAVANVTKKFGLDISANLFKEVLSSFGGRLKKIVCGGAPMDPSMVKCFSAFGITIVEGYGITECSPLISVSPYYRQKPGSVGPTVRSCVARIDDPQPDADGRMIGEILVKGQNVMLGYYKNYEATAEVFTDDGWFRTGDLGYMDKDGYIFITGRKKNVIVLNNGKNVFPEEIEEYLAKIEIINECVVIGRTNEDTGEVVLTAVVYPNFDMFSGKELTEIADEVRARIQELNKTLPSFKQIRNVDIKKTEFEKTSSRKIKRFLVK